MTPHELVEGCLDLLGLSSVARDTREALAEHMVPFLRDEAKLIPA